MKTQFIKSERKLIIFGNVVIICVNNNIEYAISTGRVTAYHAFIASARAVEAYLTHAYSLKIQTLLDTLLQYVDPGVLMKVLRDYDLIVEITNSDYQAIKWAIDKPISYLDNVTTTFLRQNMLGIELNHLPDFCDYNELFTRENSKHYTCIACGHIAKAELTIVRHVIEALTAEYQNSLFDFNDTPCVHLDEYNMHAEITISKENYPSFSSFTCDYNTRVEEVYDRLLAREDPMTTFQFKTGLNFGGPDDFDNRQEIGNIIIIFKK
jgi:hypothetical protein